MAIPVDIKPIEPTAATSAGSNRGESVYGLYRDGESQLWVLAQLRKRGGKLMISYEHAKKVFNFPDESKPKANTWLANANHNLKDRGPKWLKLGIRDGKTDEPKIFFKCALDEVKDLPTLAELCDIHGIEVDRANDLLEKWELPHIGDDDIPVQEDDDTDAEDEDEEDTEENGTEEEETPEPDPEPAKPKKKTTRSRSRGKKK
jgi:hypothetical protein